MVDGNLSDYKPRKFSRKETALVLGISERYLSTLESEHTMVARRNDMGKPVYGRRPNYHRDRDRTSRGREPWTSVPRFGSAAVRSRGQEG